MAFIVGCIVVGALLGIGAGLARYLSTTLALGGCLFLLVILAVTLLAVVLVWKMSWIASIVILGFYLARWLDRHNWFREPIRRRWAACNAPREN